MKELFRELLFIFTLLACAALIGWEGAAFVEYKKALDKQPEQRRMIVSAPKLTPPLSKATIRDADFATSGPAFRIT